MKMNLIEESPAERGSLEAKRKISKGDLFLGACLFAAIGVNFSWSAALFVMLVIWISILSVPA
jgi:hypothetical protein